MHSCGWQPRHGVDGSHCPRWHATWTASSSLTPPSESDMNILHLLHAQWQHNLQWSKKGKEASVFLLLWGPGAAVHLPKYVSVCVVNGAFSFDVPSLGMGSNGNLHGNKHAKAEKILIVSTCVRMCVCVCVCVCVLVWARLYQGFSHTHRICTGWHITVRWAFVIICLPFLVVLSL